MYFTTPPVGILGTKRSEKNYPEENQDIFG